MVIKDKSIVPMRRAFPKFNSLLHGEKLVLENKLYPSISDIFA